LIHNEKKNIFYRFICVGLWWSFVRYWGR